MPIRRDRSEHKKVTTLKFSMLSLAHSAVQSTVLLQAGEMGQSVRHNNVSHLIGYHCRCSVIRGGRMLAVKDGAHDDSSTPARPYVKQFC